jgi:hypothetical protein
MLPHNKDTDIPFVGTTIGPYVGFRVFEYDGRNSPKVMSPYKDTFQWWPKRTREKAYCWPDPTSSHDAPVDDHACGYYLYYELDDAVTTASRFKTALPLLCEFVGLVAAWGAVVHHEKGLRSSDMEILAFHDGPYDLKSKIEEVADEMGVPYLKTDDLLEFAKESGVLQKKEI